MTFRHFMPHSQVSSGLSDRQAVSSDAPRAVLSTGTDNSEFNKNWPAHASQFMRMHAAVWLPWTLVAIGIVLRLRQYLFDRSLWLDEAFLALDISHESFAQLGRLLRYGQAPPIGFAATEKCVVTFLGNSEYALRLVPLLAGAAAVFLFYLAAKATLRRTGATVALALFAISGPLVYYSSETKSYSVDVLVAVGLYVLALPMEDMKWKRSRSVWLGIVGATTIWFSHPAVFILAGIGLTLSIASVTRRQWATFRSLVFPFLLWIVSFGACYWLILRHEVHNTILLRYWQAAFAPFPPHSYSDIAWYANTLFDVFASPAGLAAAGLAVALFIIGCGSLLKRRKIVFFLLVTPVALTLAASAIHRYPFRGRLILFLVPTLLLFAAEGVDYLKDKSSSRLASAAVMVVLFFTPTLSAVHHLVKPETREEIRPVLQYIRRRAMAGDLLYLYHPSSYAFRYYDERDRIPGLTVIRGQSLTGNWDRDAADISRLRGHRRVWILFSHVRTEDGTNEESLLLHLLSEIGKQRASFHAPGAATYLYDLQ